MLRKALENDILFEKLSSSEINYVVDSSIEFNFKKQELLCKQGLVSNYVFYVHSGYVKLIVESWGERELIIAIGTPDSFVGLFYLIGRDNYPYSVKALTDVCVSMIPRDVFQEIARKNNEFLYALTSSMGRSVLEMSLKMLALNKKNVRGRVADILIFFAEQIFKSEDFTLPMTRQDIANMTSISVENIVRVLSEFDRDKIIRINNKRIIILNKKALLIISLKG